MEPGNQLVRHRKPRNRPCAHNTYRLDCSQYELLRADAGDRCQLCHIEPAETPQGYLVIDHDPKVGWWAVRGLVCSTCNTTRIPFEAPTDLTLRQFLANPWYQRTFGVGPELPPEPPQGTRATYRKRIWVHEDDRWYSQNGHLEPLEPQWKDLHYSYGAHNLQLIAPQPAEFELERLATDVLSARRDDLKRRVNTLRHRRLTLDVHIGLMELRLSELNSEIIRRREQG